MTFLNTGTGVVIREVKPEKKNPKRGMLTGFIHDVINQYKHI